MRPHTDRTLIFISVVLLAICISNAVGQDPVCVNALVFEIKYKDGNAEYIFRLQHTGTIFSAKNNCTEDTLNVVPALKGMDISTELNFLRKQWSGLRQTASMSPMGKAGMSLDYRFDPFTKRHYFHLSSRGYMVISCCDNKGNSVITDYYKSDKLVQICKYGIAVDELRNNARSLATKWGAYCEELKANRSRTTLPPPFPRTSTPPATEQGIILVTTSTYTPNASNADSIKTTDALSAGGTVSIVAIILLITIVAPAVVIAWRWRESLRTRIRESVTWITQRT